MQANKATIENRNKWKEEEAHGVNRICRIIISFDSLYEAEDASSVLELKKQLRDKDMKLTDIRLEALSSAHQLEQLRETMNKMKVHTLI